MGRQIIGISIIVLCLLWACPSKWLDTKTTYYNDNTDNRQEEEILISNDSSSTSIFSIRNIAPSVDSLYYYDREYYTIGYNNYHRQPSWVAWLLTKKMVKTKKVKRQNNFRIDEGLKCCASSPADYNHSGYDKGHLCPSGDMTWSRSANSATFLMSNMSPQNQKLNRGRWNDLENKERSWAFSNDSMIIIAGGIFSNSLGKIGSSGVTVPSAFYKIIIDISYPHYKAIGFIMPNKNSKQSIYSYAVSINEIERQTGLKFFPNNSKDSLVISLKYQCDTNAWE